MKTERLLSYYVHRFFAEHLSRDRGCSPNTLRAYRDALSLFFRYLAERQRIRPEAATIDVLVPGNVLAFLHECQAIRGNTASTRNARLAGIRALVRYVSMVEPTRSHELSAVLAIPVKRAHRRVLGYMTRPEVNALLDSPRSDTWSGRRDRVLFLAMYNSGARVSEILRVKACDVQLGPTTTLHLHGKGRKDRVLPLWKKTAVALRHWINRTRVEGDGLLFTNARGAAMTRSGVAKRLASATRAASHRCPALKRKGISPHTLRHTIAMHMLQAGVDITVVAMWLGHESIETTHIYVSSDMAMKEKGLASLQAPSQRNRRFRPDDKLLVFLESI